jgi:hypothetical protein
MAAFEVARENLEKILASDSVTETVEYGTSDQYPDISWQTVVEVFSEPISGGMWARAVCSAEFEDAAGEMQTVKLEHWLSALTDQQANQLAGQEDLEQLEADQLVETVEEAAEHAGVDAETIERWIENGLVTTEDGYFIRHNLDIYVRSNGEPTDEEKAEQVESIEDLALAIRQQMEGTGETLNTGDSSDGKDSVTGLPFEELEKMGVGDVVDLLRQRREQR